MNAKQTAEAARQFMRGLPQDNFLDTITALCDAIEELTTPVKYRPGLPTPEQVRTHEAFGGWWQTIDEDGLDVTRLTGRDMACILDLPAWYTKASFRPCTEDGTAISWSLAEAPE